MKPQDPAFKLAVLHTTTHIHRDPLTGLITTPTSSDIPASYEEEAATDEPKPKINRPLRTAYVLHRAKDGFAGRGNTVASYTELNRQVRIPISDPPYSMNNP